MRPEFFPLMTAVMLLSGCLTAVGPMPNDGELSADSPLVGYWVRLVRSDDGRETAEVLTIYPSEKLDGRLAVIDSFGRVFEPAQADQAQDTPDTDVYDFFISRAGGKTFVNLLDRSEEVPRYIIMKYVYDGGGPLTVWNVSDDFLSEKARQYPVLFGGSSVLNLSGRELASFVGTLKDDAYDDPAVYERWNGSVRALRAFAGLVPLSSGARTPAVRPRNKE